MIIAAKTFGDGSIRAEIVPNEDREGVNCFVFTRHPLRGLACSSLAVVEDFGAIEPDDPREVKVPDAIIDQIRAFAESHGY